MNLFRKYGIPGPKPNFITGNMNEFHEKREKCIDEWLEKYGKIFGFFLGAKPYIICTDVEFIKLMQIKEFKTFANKDLVLPDAGVPHKLSFDFLELQKDEKWKNMRSILGISFSTGKIKMMSTLMTDPINNFLKNIEKEKEEPFDITIFFKKLTFDIVCRSAFGITTNVQNNETTKFVQSVYSLFEVDSSDILPIVSICFPEFEPIPTYIRHIIDAIRNMINLPSSRVVVKTCREIIDSRKKSEYHPPDLLQTILNAEGDSVEEKKLSTDEVISNALAFMLAGYDTTSSTLGWCSYYLACHPEIQERLRQEINDNIEGNEEIQYNDLNNFQYMDQFVSEALRLSPLTIIVINRVCAEDFKYKDITIPKGAIILVPNSILQKDPNYWEEPEKFDPDRFSLENRGKINPFIYQPFGAGPRICIGMRMANTVVKLTLANLIRSFRLDLHGSKELELDYSLFINRPKNGIMIKAIPLNN